MKILITGSFCSGKSTLSSQLSLKLKDSLLIEEVSRELLEVYNNGIDWTLPELRDYLIVRQLFLEKKASLQSASYIIVDSGVISNIAHDRLLNPSSQNRENLMNELGHSRYDLVFCCDHSSIELVHDGKRYANKNLQDKLLHEIRETLEYLNYKSYIWLKGTIKERLNIALDWIFQWREYEK